MDWLSLSQGMPRDGDMPERAARIAALSAVLNGRHYDHIPHPFSEETNGAGEYIPLRKRRPSVRSGLCRTVVDDSVSLLFSEGHFPAVHSADARTVDALAALIKERRLNEVLVEAATRGSVGSTAILFRVLRGKPYFSVLDTAFLTPSWDPEEPDALLKVTERYKVRGRDLAANGYAIPGDGAHEHYWFMREWDADQERWYRPWRVADRDAAPSVDDERTVTHGLGFVPVVWIRNLPGGDATDGACTFEAAIDAAIRIDYTLSQSGRALDYAGDPKLVIRGADGQLQGLNGGAGKALVLADQGDAKLLEINGSSATAALEFVRYLRAVALESVHGNRTDADKLSAAQSGRAMEMMNQGLIWLADRLRIAYGEGGLLSLLRMVCRASAVVQKSEGGLLIGGTRHRDLRADDLALVWPRWYAPTADDRQQEATTLSTLVRASLMSRATALRVLASTYDVEDLEAERLLIEADEGAAGTRERVKATEGLPA